jgi:hypothetical protein
VIPLQLNLGVRLTPLRVRKTPNTGEQRGTRDDLNRVTCGFRLVVVPDVELD